MPGVGGFAEHARTARGDHADSVLAADRDRRLIADALTVRGWRVLHLGAGREPAVHELPSFAVVRDGVLSYPPAQPSLFTEQPRS